MAALALAITLLSSAEARAEDPARASFEGKGFGHERPILALRGSVGVGLGAPGIGGRYSGIAELWVARHLGAGLEASPLGQTGKDRLDTSAQTMTPLLGGRLPGPQQGHFILRLGAGYARAARRSHRYHAFAASSAIGWAGAPGGNPLQAGVFGRFDAIVDPRGNLPATYLGSLNLELGFGI